LRRALAGVLLCFLPGPVRADEPGFLGRWTIERADPAPWVESARDSDESIAEAYVGESVSFEERRIDGPALLACADPSPRLVEVPAEGLFQGGLAGKDVDVPKARETATRMGFKKQPVRTVVTACEHDIAFHLRDDDHAAFALDNWIFWMKRQRQDPASANAPRKR
jgi:hypothetical protein